ncbi:MAG: hypothetical protein M1814_002062 [Vezdaea aestivalis]|nr:MAG: hypothetical protein M1814_002062 [Vezdaea aestivalis]
MYGPLQKIIIMLPFAFNFYIFSASAWSPIFVKSVTDLGPQLTPNLTNVSRDGGYSVLINRQIVWLYDDTECLSRSGKQLSFVSNTAAYASELSTSVTTVQDFGIELAGQDSQGRSENAILGFGAVGDGGWIPFENGEAEYNKEHNGNERIAIWPNTAPAAIDRYNALLYAPLIYVDPTPINPTKHYISRGMTQITITAPLEGPQAVRGQSGLVFPGDAIQFGGFAMLPAYPSLEAPNSNDNRDLYLLGVTDNGLQLCRVAIAKSKDFEAMSYWSPRNQSFSKIAPRPDVKEKEELYIPGSFSSGSLFYSPYFKTFLLVYFDHFADSLFLVRYLNLSAPFDSTSKIWPAGGRQGGGVFHEDVEALVHYSWSDSQLLFNTTPKAGGFNYAGVAHPEYFNRAYYPTTDYYYPPGQVFGEKRGEWYGESVIPEAQAGGDGRNLLVSWTAQLKGGVDSGIYQPHVGLVRFDDIPQPGERPIKGDGTPTPQKYPHGYFGPISLAASLDLPLLIGLWRAFSMFVPFAVLRFLW